MTQTKLRNIAIIAHVDHGKTTLVDAMLWQAGVFRQNQQVAERVMDSNALERERGITILAKNTVVTWGDTRINIIDTPGHADFGGEVERILSMADGALLLVDAYEGVMPQTRFVLTKAFANGLKPIVVLNKVDKPDARPKEALDEVFDLFVDLGADDVALDFPAIYASGRGGWAATKPGETGTDLRPLFEMILKHVPAPEDDPEGALQFRVSTLDYNDFVGRIAIGRVHRGRIRKNDKVMHVSRTGERREAMVRNLYRFDGLGRQETDMVAAGDLCAVAGFDPIDIGDSITDLQVVEPLTPIAIDEPTLNMVFRINDSPFAGRDGKYVTSRHLRERLQKELLTNVALRVEPTETPDAWSVSGRGVLHLGILIENMRREGFEFAASKPKVITKEENGQTLEPLEFLVVDTPERSSGKVIEYIGSRRGELLTMSRKGTFQHLEFRIPSRGLIGARTRVLNLTSGEAIMHHNFLEYGEWRGHLPSRINGVMVSMVGGIATGYSLDALRDRGDFFLNPQTEIYEGMIVGEHCKEGDIVVNLAREKKMTNVRSSNKELVEKLPVPRIHGVEEALEYVEEDELVEFTPKSVRLRKVLLNEKDRRKAGREAAVES